MSARLNRAQPYALGLFRIVIGFLFACHGAASLFGILGGPVGGGPAPSVGTWPSWYAAVIHLVGGALIALGVGTRIAAFLCSGSMAYAYFKVHQPDALFPLENGGEAAAVLCWVFLLLVFTGPGALAVDRLFSSRGNAARDDSRRPHEQAPAVSV